MTRRDANTALLAGVVSVAASAIARADDGVIALPEPRQNGGKPLTDALKLRRSIREYADHPLSPQVLSDLLWSAFGVNRPSGDRTAPYWRHIMVIDVYAAMADGVWLYDPAAHRCCRISKRTSGRRPGCRILSAARRSISSTWRMVSACTTSRRPIDGSMRRSTPALSARTSICSAPPKGSPLSFAVPSLTRSSHAPCNSIRSSS